MQQQRLNDDRFLQVLDNSRSRRLSPVKTDKRDEGDDNFSNVSNMAEKKSKVAEECFLTLNDFVEMDSSGDRPEIMIHVIKTLTGVNIASIPDRISEEPEHEKVKVIIPLLA